MSKYDHVLDSGWGCLLSTHLQVTGELLEDCQHIGDEKPDFLVHMQST